MYNVVLHTHIKFRTKLLGLHAPSPHAPSRKHSTDFDVAHLRDRQVVTGTEANDVAFSPGVLGLEEIGRSFLGRGKDEVVDERREVVLHAVQRGVSKPHSSSAIGRGAHGAPRK